MRLGAACGSGRRPAEPIHAPRPGTPRTIEGLLYITDAPSERGEARLDQDPDEGEVLFVEGQARDTTGMPIPGAIVDVWHANTKGFYSFFDQTPTPQSPYNLRRRIETDIEGRYRFRTIMPSGYGCPPDGQTQQLLDRHGKRPAHVHFFVEASGFRKLTTQIHACFADAANPHRRPQKPRPRGKGWRRVQSPFSRGGACGGRRRGRYARPASRSGSRRA